MVQRYSPATSMMPDDRAGLFVSHADYLVLENSRTAIVEEHAKILEEHRTAAEQALDEIRALRSQRDALQSELVDVREDSERYLRELQIARPLAEESLLLRAKLAEIRVAVDAIEPPPPPPPDLRAAVATFVAAVEKMLG